MDITKKATSNPGLSGKRLLKHCVFVWSLTLGIGTSVPKHLFLVTIMCLSIFKLLVGHQEHLV